MATKMPDETPSTSAAAMASERDNEDSVEDQLLEIGKHYLVHSKSEDWLPAKIISVRFNDQSNQNEYFVHYEGYDRRLDEWILQERIMNSSFDMSEQQLIKTRRPSTRDFKRRQDEINHVKKAHDELDPRTAAFEKKREADTKIKYINEIQIGSYEIETWYFSPYPDEFGKARKLFICEYCLKYSNLGNCMKEHVRKCTRRYPPGNEIYRKGTISVWEIYASQHKLYCQCLCLLAKLFLDHKMVCFDVTPFIFYVMCVTDRQGSHIVGYFSKEKNYLVRNNVSCILIMPPFQRYGYGKFLISFSYELSKIKGVVEGPEQPLSDLGKVSYRSYWSWVLMDLIRDTRGPVSIKELSEKTSIAEKDIISTLQTLNVLKFWKGRPVLCVTPKVIEEYVRSSKKPTLTVDLSCLRWKPPTKAPQISDE